MTRCKFDRLIEELLPVLHVHFLRQGVKSSMFCSQWFLTMFSYRQVAFCIEAPIVTFRRFPLEIVFRIYDSCLANGIEAIFGFSVALLKRNEEALLALKFDAILAFLSNRLLDVYKVCVFVSEIGVSPKLKFSPARESMSRMMQIGLYKILFRYR